MRLLNDTQAAIYLGITKELLYAYVRNSPKGDGRTLLTTVKDGNNYFEETELEAFDHFLKEPWAGPNDKRPPIPSYIKDYLKTEIQGKCPITGKGFPLEDAHIDEYAVSLNHHHHNLIRICNEVHSKSDKKVVPKKILVETKLKLIEANRQRLIQEDMGYRMSFSPPKPNSFFVGRLKKLLELTSSMEFHRMVVIQGIGGIGKTQLLLNGIDNVKYHNPILWFDVEQINSVNDLIFQLISALNQSLGIVITSSLVDGLKTIPLTIVLDSLEKLQISQHDAIEDFIHDLMTKTDNVQLLITTQVDMSVNFDEKKIIELNGLDEDASRIILFDQNSKSPEILEKQLDWIIQFCGGHPLSLKIVSSLLKFYESSERTIKQLNKYDSVKHPTRKEHNKSTALSACLNSVYENLTKEQRKLLHIAKFYPSGVKTIYLEKDFDTLYEDMSILSHFFLIEKRQDSLGMERFSISNPILKFIFDKAKIETEDRGVLLQKEQLISIVTELTVIAQYHIENSKQDSTALGIARMEDELPNCLNAFRITQRMIELAKERKNEEHEIEYLQLMAGIAGALGKFCFIRGYFNYGIMFSKAGIEASVELGEVISASTQYMYLAQLQLRQYDLEALEKTCNDLCNLAKRTKNLSVKADCHWMRGRLAHQNGHLLEAIDEFKKAQKLITQEYQESEAETPAGESIDVSTRGNLALIDSEIAHAFTDLGEHKKAIDYYKKSIEIQRSLNDHTNLMSCYHQLANCMTQVGDMDGLEYYFKAIEGFKRYGSFEYLANSIAELGRFVLEHPELAKHQLLDEETITSALDGLTYQFEDYFNRSNSISDNSELEAVPFPLVGKGILVMKLVSFTEHSHLLFDWCENFRDKLKSNLENDKYFIAFINVAHIIGGFGYGETEQEKKKTMIKYLLQGTLLLNGGPDLKSKTFIFYWLAAWMKHTKIDPNATPESLLEASWASFEN